MRAKSIYAVYDAKNCTINADPDTNKQRYDKFKRVFNVSDVKIKRIIRDYLHKSAFDVINTFNDEDFNALAIENKAKKQNTSKDEKSDDSITGITYRLESLFKKRKINLKEMSILDIKKSIRKFCIDWRLFGGIITNKKYKCNDTGTLQFDTVSESINKVNPRDNMIDMDTTSKVPTNTEKTAGGMGSTPMMKYGVFCTQGRVCPTVASINTCSEKDIEIALYALWNGLKTYSSRNKNITPLFIIVINYKTEQLINEITNEVSYIHPKYFSNYRPFTVKSKLPNDVDMENVRDFSELEFDFSNFADIQSNDNVESVDIYVDDMSDPRIYSFFTNLPDKFKLNYITISNYINLIK